VTLNELPKVRIAKLDELFEDVGSVDDVMKYLFGLVVRVPGYRSRGADSIPGATRFSKK
jgi:hypothetical protein